MLAEELQIYKDTFQLCVQLTNHIKNVSREVKFTDYADVRRDAKNALNIIFIINSDINSRQKNIERYLYYVSNVKSGVRLLHEAKYLSTKFSTNIMWYIDRVTKQAIGWRNSSQRNSQNR